MTDKYRVICHLLKQISPRLQERDMARTTMMSGCRLHGKCKLHTVRSCIRSSLTISRTVVEKGTGEEEVVVTCNLEPEERGKPEAESESDAGEQDPEDANEDEKPTKNEEANEKPKIDPRDPIRWFGVLVPPTLRSAQSQFIGIVEGPIPQLVTLIKELRALEIEIGRTRKSIKKLEK